MYIDQSWYNSSSSSTVNQSLSCKFPYTVSISLLGGFALRPLRVVYGIAVSVRSFTGKSPCLSFLYVSFKMLFGFVFAANKEGEL